MSPRSRTSRLPLFLALQFVGVLAAGPAGAAFFDNGDGTVTDSATGLMWDKCTWGKTGNTCAAGSAAGFGWQGALGVAVTANASVYKNYGDWRVPNVAELDTLVNIAITNPAIDMTAFPGTVSNAPNATIYWSSTVYVFDATKAWEVDFTSGSVSALFQTTGGYVRLVRGGKYASFDAQVANPNPFGFTPQTNLLPGALATSDTITVSGLATGTSIWIAGGSYKIGNGAYTTAAGAANNGDHVTVQQTASAGFSKKTTATLTIGSVTGDFDVTTRPGTLDVDLNGSYDFLTDGLLALRYMMGLTGNNLTVGAVGPSAQYTDAGTIAAFLASLGLALDIDGDQTIDPMTDGLLILRYMAGLRGDALVAGATAPGAPNTTSQIMTKLSGLMP